MFILRFLTVGLLVTLFSGLTEGDFCVEGRRQERCQCQEARPSDNSACIMDRPYASVCSGRGRCVCGRWCECELSPTNYTNYIGQYCECNDVDCRFFDYYKGMPCGGPTRGECQCGFCVCKPGYEGPGCRCPTGGDTCRATSGLVCNGKGSCECGRCVCDPESFFKGPTCEDCPTCPGKCEEYKACVQCKAFMTGPLSKEDCDSNCTHVVVGDPVEGKLETRTCVFRDEEGSQYNFTYYYDVKRVDVPKPDEKVLTNDDHTEGVEDQKQKVEKPSNTGISREPAVCLTVAVLILSRSIL